MKAEFVAHEKPDVQITMSYKQAQKLMFVLFPIEGSDDLADLWNVLDDLALDGPNNIKFEKASTIRVIDDE